MITLKSNEKTIQIYPAIKEAPLVIYHAVRGEGKALFRECQKADCPDFNLAVINDINWDDEMTPWPIPPISLGDTPCTGGADIYLKKLTDEILPQIIGSLPYPPTYLALSGYSLAGLFAVYAGFETDLFSRIISASGSLWYPDFLPFVQNNHMSNNVSSIYFSLGDKESHTKNKYLAPVEDNTRYLAKYFSNQGIKTTFILNKGNHYQNSIG